AQLKTILEQRHDIASKSRIIDFLISFQVPTLVPMIQITGSNRAPVVAHNHLGVDKAWLEFVDSNTMAQQALVITPTGITNTGVIHFRARQQHANIEAPLRSSHQHAPDSP